MDARITVADLRQSLASSQPPLVIDVRRSARFLESSCMVQGAVRRNPETVEQWKNNLPPATSVVVYCVHGHEVSQNAARVLGARYLEGGIEAWREAGGELFGKPANAATRWVTRERPKIDRIACPWLVRRFVDADAEFLYVPAPEVKRVATQICAVPYDIADVDLSHVGDKCSFDAFIRFYNLNEPALDALALIVRGADTNRLDLVPQCAGLAAVSQGLSRNFPDDQQMLEHGMVLYDALYAWCKR